MIVIEGPIGVGKTTLAKKLAGSLQANLILEDAEDNPFLERFYQQPELYALPTQLHFLFQRHKQMATVLQGDLFQDIWIADYLIDKDRLFAEITLADDELHLYQQVYQQLAPKRCKPDLVIYLQAPVPVLLERVRKRGRPEERPVQQEYLQKVADAYTRFFHFYDASPLLIVNASGLDLVDNPEHYQALLDRIQNTQSGRNYFNPLID
jgi:deoxyadenosine/deoxycytidine kinase